MSKFKLRIVAMFVLVAVVLGILPVDYFEVYAADSWDKVDSSNTFVIYNSYIKGSELISILQSVDSEYDRFKYAYDNPGNHNTIWANFGIEIISDNEYCFEFGAGDTVPIYYAPDCDWETDSSSVIYIKRGFSPETETIDLRQPAIVDDLAVKDFGRFDTVAEFENEVKCAITASWSNSSGSGKVDSHNIDIALFLSNETKNSFGETVKIYSVTVSISEGENWLASEQDTVFDDVFWTVNQYTITFDTKGGSDISPIKQDYGTSIIAPLSPTKGGYNFAGWDKDIPAAMPAENITITAKWEEATKKVSFDTNGGNWSDGSSDTKTEILKLSDSVETLSIPAKEGYNFGGWKKDEITKSGVDESYTAIWTLGQTVTFKDGDVVSSKNYAVGETIIVPQLDERVGYTFIGWDLVDENGIGDGAKDPVISVMGDENVTYVSIWQVKIFRIQFLYENGELIEERSFPFGAEVVLPDEPYKEGYTFIGWDLKKNGEYDGTVDEVILTMIAEDLEYKEIYEINQYTITFDTDGGTPIAPITYNYGTAIAPPPHPTKLGCKFDKWDINIPQTMPAKNITITAHWVSNNYTITFDTDGGNTIEPITQSYGSAITLFGDPQKTGYTFAGWDKEIPETMPAENIVLKAKWTINQYTIIFDTDGGSDVAPIIQDYGTPVTVPGHPTKEHHTFVGWDMEIPATMPAENIVIKAKWNAISYTITFDTDGGSAIAPITQAYGTAVTNPSAPTKDGYKFIGWDKDIPSTMPGENVIITAKWEEAAKNVSFDPNGGVWSDGTKEIKTQKLNLDYDVDSYTAPKRNGYDFGGWKKAETAIPGADESYIAIWNDGKTITFKDGDTVYEHNYAAGEAVTAPQLGDRIGHTFIGWDLVGANGVGDGFKDQVPSVMGNEEVTYVAIWEANKYTVTFYYENGELYEAHTKRYGESFGISNEPSKTGYIFVGWDLKKDGVYDGIADAVSSTMGAENLEYKEIFAIGQYTITFDSAGGSAVAPITQSYGTDVVPPAHPTKEGYTFEGWDLAVPLIMPAQNITLTARWKKAVYTISWDINGDGIIDDRDIVTIVDHGEMPAFPPTEVPTKESTEEFFYEFTGSWIPAIKLADGDATYTAQFNASRRKYTVKFLNYDGTPLQITEVEYGSIPTYNGDTPTKNDDIQYDYTFAGWSPKIDAVKADATYTATFTESIKKYTVIWQNWDGSVLETDHGVEYGDLPRFDGKTPSRTSTDERTYQFAGWSPQVSGVTADVTYTATFTEKANSYTITWLNDDGSVIDVTVVEYGKIPSYAAPTKPSNAEYSYSFAGWTPTIVAVTGNATYTASYTATKNKYTVIWNVGGTKITEQYEYGSLPEFNGSTDKASDGCTTFSFIGWDKKISAVIGNAEYIATYSTATKHISEEFLYQNNVDGTHIKMNKCCSAVVETVACADSPNDGNHKCDLCFADNIGFHNGGRATCKTFAKCDECGAFYGAYDAKNHESAQIVFADITKTTHNEFYACCKAVKAENVLHIFSEGGCVCGELKTVSIKLMNGASVFKTLDGYIDNVINISDISATAPTKGYVFAGWYTQDGIQVKNEIELTEDLVLVAKYYSGDIDGNGKLEASDADMLNRYIVGESVRAVDDRKAFDVNGDGKISVLDSVALLLHISGKQLLTHKI